MVSCTSELVAIVSAPWNKMSVDQNGAQWTTLESKDLDESFSGTYTKNSWQMWVTWESWTLHIGQGRGSSEKEWCQILKALFFQSGRQGWIIIASSSSSSLENNEKTRNYAELKVELSCMLGFSGKIIMIVIGTLGKILKRQTFHDTLQKSALFESKPIWRKLCLMSITRSWE